jgi:hypothetical protein
MRSEREDALPSITMTGATLPGAASDTPPWPVRVAKSLLGYGMPSGVVEERLAEGGAELGKVVWGCLADRIGDLHGRLSSVVSLPPAPSSVATGVVPWPATP